MDRSSFYSLNTFIMVNKHRKTSRIKRRKLESPSTEDALVDAKETNFAKLPSNCVQHILSFVTFEKLCEIRQVSKVFNAAAIKLLSKGQKELERRLKSEIERAEKRVFSPNSVRSSFDMLHFLRGLQQAINNCTITYSLHRDYFVAGKLLDETSYLLKDFNSSSILTYFPDNVCDQNPHPLLAPIIAHSDRAWRHFETEILNRNVYVIERPEHKRDVQNVAELGILIEQNKMKLMKTNLLKTQRHKVNCGEEMGREFFKLILNLNEIALDLTQLAKKEDQEVERAINGMGKSHNNSLLHLPMTSRAPFGVTKITRNQVGSTKRPKLATLPPPCIQNIVSHLKCDRIAQLRLVCKSFNAACKNELIQEFEKLEQKVIYKIKQHEKSDLYWADKPFASLTNLMKDLCRYLQLCKSNYKWYLGTNYYFTAGKVVDEAECLYHRIYVLYHYVGDAYKCKTHYSLYPLMDLVYKAFAHFKFNMVPEYFPLTLNRTYVPNYVIRGDQAMNFEQDSHLDLENIEKLIEAEDAKIKEQNKRNGTYLNIISGLKKQIFILNNKISENLLNKLK